MKVTTKKIQLDKNTYVKLAFLNLLKEQWWVGLIFLAICAGTFAVPSNWWWIGATIALVLYFLFWLIQFAGISQVEQGKMLFEKQHYDITSKNITIWVDKNRHMPLSWNQVKGVTMGKDYYLVKLSLVQFIYFPFKSFKSEDQRKLLNYILVKKGYIKG